MSNWQNALKAICKMYTDSNVDLEWILVGSVGSVLQGCEMNPGDIDIYVKNEEDVMKFAEILKEYSRVEKSEGYDQWFSSYDEPTFTQTFLSGFTWTKGRWIIEDVEVEVVNISNSAGIPDSMDGDGIWEGGKYIWNLAKVFNFEEYQVSVVPIEIQLESNLRRERQERIDAIMDALKKNGYNLELIEKALSTKHLPYFYKEMGLVREEA